MSVADDSPLSAALARWHTDTSPAHAGEVFAALVDAVVLVGTRARLVSEGTAEQTGLRAEKEAELDLLTVALEDGRRVLPVFSDAGLLRRWRLDARPVQAAAREACRAVLDEGWSALVLDPGSADFAVSGAALEALAAGFLPVAGRERLSVGEEPADLDLPAEPPPLAAQQIDALRRALAREPALEAAWLIDVAAGLRVAVLPRTRLDPAGVATVAERIGARLVADGVPAGLALVVIGPEQVDRVAAACRPLWP